MDIIKLGPSALNLYLSSRENRPSPPTGELAQNNRAKQNLAYINAQAVDVTISEQAKQLKEMLDPEAEVEFPQFNPDDAFSYRPNHQWKVFDTFFRNNGIYDSLTETEKKELRQTLRDVTRGMDSLDPLGARTLDSQEAQLEFISSITALEYIGEKFFSGDTKKEFNQFVDGYSKHNAQRLVGYQSLEESFKAGLAKLDNSQFSLSLADQRERRMIGKLIKTETTANDYLELQKSYREKFEQIQDQTDIKAVLQQVQDQMLDFVTKGIADNDDDKDYAKQYIANRSEKTFQRIESYWEKLLQY